MKKKKTSRTKRLSRRRQLSRRKRFSGTKRLTFGKYFTKQLLEEAARNADNWDFNRQLDFDAIQTLPDARFPVSFSMMHHHRHGEPAETHVRARVVMDAHGGAAFVDMPLAFWERLPIAKLAA